MRESSLVAEAITLLRAELAGDVRISEVAARTYTDHDHLCRLFKRVTGLTPAAYRTAARVERAIDLLLHTDLPVTQVCFEVGYNSLGTFITRFKQWVGLSPGQFRSYARCRRPAVCLTARKGCAAGGSVSGQVEGHVPAVPIYLALFAKPFPHQEPIRCAVLPRSGPFCLDGVRAGRYYLLAAANSAPRFCGDLAGADFVACTPSPIIVENGVNVQGVQVRLRRRLATDPPILGVYPE